MNYPLERAKLLAKIATYKASHAAQRVIELEKQCGSVPEVLLEKARLDADVLRAEQAIAELEVRELEAMEDSGYVNTELWSRHP